MAFLDTIQSTISRVLPEKKTALPMRSSSTGIAGGGMLPFQDDVSFLPLSQCVSPPFLVRHRSLVVFATADGPVCPP